MQDPNLRAGSALLYQLSTEFSASEIFEKRRMLEAKVVPLSKDTRNEAVLMFKELQWLVCIQLCFRDRYIEAWKSLLDTIYIQICM